VIASGLLARRRGQHAATAPEDRWAWARPVELVLVVLVGAAATVPAMLTQAHTEYDSFSYLHFSLYRLPVVPALYAALTHNYRAIIVVQSLIGALCWGYLALEALRSTRRPACYVAFLGVLAVSACDLVTHWYTAILSDSLSLSLLALLLASLSSWLGRRGSLARVVVVALLWAGTRDTNGYLLLVVGLIGLVVVLVRARRTGLVIAAMVAIAGGIAVIWSADAGGEWVEPFQHVLTERILTDPARLAWFHAHGMPVSPSLTRLAGPWGLTALHALTNSPQLEAFRAWMQHSAERTYLEYALVHPWWALSGTFGPQQVFNDSLLAYYSNTPRHTYLPTFIRQFLLQHELGTLFVATGGAALCLVAKVRSLAAERVTLMWWGAIAITGYLGLVIDWVGDSWEVGRHSIGSVVQIWVAMTFLAAIALGTRRPAPADDSRTARPT
jgi:hypothetical protein